MEKSIEKISELYTKYKDDDFMINKLDNYIQKQLECILENTKKDYNQRVNRLEEMTCEQDEFIDRFLQSYRYYYSPQSEIYFSYDGIRYVIQNEDAIITHVLTSISREGNLMAWKQKTKNIIMKKIRDKNITSCIPESETIQQVFELLCPIFFKNKSETKYFLTVIGDNILKKNTQNTYFVHENAKHFIRSLNNICQMLLAVDCHQTIRYRYHDHDYTLCRLLSINDCIKYETLWNTILSNHALNILCIACHYSIRYNNADHFIQNCCSDSRLIEKSLYVANTDKDKLIDEFISANLDKDESQVMQNKKNKNTLITWKNMQYLWKQFLDKKNLPSVIFLQSLKSLLISKLNNFYDEETDCFYHICSKNLPSIQKFIDFWNNTMYTDASESDLEIDEVGMLFKKWCSESGLNIHLNEEQLIDLLTYYFPHIEIEDMKYIHGIRCYLWDKHGDINAALTNYKEIIQNKYYQPSDVQSPSIYPNISLYDIYTYYCKFLQSISKKLIVSKMYFEKYITESYSDYILEDKFLSSSWYLP
tara:strand:- start:189 stop:1790 length:1602 start_codon:yes stop_codon:yes gene_type:complete